MKTLPALLQVHVATFFFGIAGLFIVSTGLSPELITFGRTFFAAVTLLLLWNIVSPQASAVTDVRVLLSAALLAVHWVIFFTSIQLSSVAIGLIMFSTTPVILAFLEPWWYREAMRLQSVVAAVLVVCGIVVMTRAYQGEFMFGRGVVWGLASAATFAVLQLLNRTLCRQHKAVSLALVQNGVACLLLAPLVLGDLPSLSVNLWLQLIFLGCVCTALAQTLFISSLREISAATASLIAGGLEPVYGIVLAAMLFSQYPDAHVLIGGAIVLLTVLYVSVKHKKST